MKVDKIYETYDSYIHIICIYVYHTNYMYITIARIKIDSQESDIILFMLLAIFLEMSKSLIILKNAGYQKLKLK